MQYPSKSGMRHEPESTWVCGKCRLEWPDNDVPDTKCPQCGYEGGERDAYKIVFPVLIKER